MKTKLNSGSFKCGRHSGFPLCCILFFIYIWAPLYTRWGDPKYKYSFTNIYHFFQNKVITWRKITHSFFNKDPGSDIDGAYIENTPGFGRQPCPFCLLFSKKTGYKSCDCE